jgi:hypothetical protein
MKKKPKKATKKRLTKIVVRVVHLRKFPPVNLRARWNFFGSDDRTCPATARHSALEPLVWWIIWAGIWKDLSAEEKVVEIIRYDGETYQPNDNDFKHFSDEM